MEIVGVAIAVLALLVMVIIFFAQRKTKKLSYEIISHTQLLSVGFREVVGEFFEPMRRFLLPLLHSTHRG